MLARVVLIAVLGFLSFGLMLPAPFRVMDDRSSIVDNPIIRSLKNIPALFQEGYFHDQSYYRPMVGLTFMVEYQAFGFNSFFYNLDNLILHVLNALLVFLLVTKLTANEETGFWTGILFVMHPVQWEAVCNIPGRSILLSAFFELGCFLLFLEFYKRRRWFYLPIIGLIFFLGLLCKESAGMLPFVILSYLALDKTNSWMEKLKCLWPFWVAIAGYIFLRKYFGITHVPEPGQPMAALLGFVTFLRSLITDLRLSFLPVDLHYDRSMPLMMSLGEPRAIFTCIFWAAAMGIFIFYHRRINPFIVFLVSWFALELLPVAQLVTSIGVGVGHISTAEHFLYLACIPVFIGMVMAFRGVYELNTRNVFVKPALLKILAGGFLAFLLMTALEQSIYASNEFSMVSRSLFFEPNNPRLQGVMGMLGVFRNDVPEAEKHFRAAIAAEPLNPTYHIALGSALLQQGEWIEGLEQLVAFDPGKDRELVERQKKVAMGHIRYQLEQGKTFDARGWLAIGIYEAQAGHGPAATAAFLKTIHLDPGQPDAWFNLGSLDEAGHDWPQARMAYKRLLDLHGGSIFQREFALKHLAAMEGKGVLNGGLSQ